NTLQPLHRTFNRPFTNGVNHAHHLRGLKIVLCLYRRVPLAAPYSAAIFLIPICISFDTAEKRRYATYLILNRRFSFEF
ncbi:Ion channel protein, partial [Escherichia coli]